MTFSPSAGGFRTSGFSRPHGPPRSRNTGREGKCFYKIIKVHCPDELIPKDVFNFHPTLPTILFQAANVSMLQLFDNSNRYKGVFNENFSVLCICSLLFLYNLVVTFRQ